MKQSRYQEIAVDLAALIINGHYTENERIAGSSALAAKYKVSSETIRKAILLLKDFGVLTSTQKNGIRVISTQNASLFYDAHQDRASIAELKHAIEEAACERTRVDEKIASLNRRLLTQLSAQRDSGVIYPLELCVPKTSPLMGKSLENCVFWKHTQATVVAIRRDGVQLLSPSPQTVVAANDVLIFVGKSSSYSKMFDYVNTGHTKKTVSR